MSNQPRKAQVDQRLCEGYYPLRHVVADSETSQRALALEINCNMEDIL